MQFLDDYRKLLHVLAAYRLPQALDLTASYRLTFPYRSLPLAAAYRLPHLTAHAAIQGKPTKTVQDIQKRLNTEPHGMKLSIFDTNR